MAVEKPLFEVIQDKARTDGQFAVAHALLRISYVLDERLAAISSIMHEQRVSLDGIASAATSADVASAIDNVANAINNADFG